MQHFNLGRGVHGLIAVNRRAGGHAGGRDAATLLRDGVAVERPLRDVVPGDVALLRAGDVIPADGVLLACEPAKVLPMAQRYFLF